MKKYDVVAPFLYGLPTTLDSNLEIDKRAKERSRTLDIPIFDELTFAAKTGLADGMDTSEWTSSTLKYVKALAIAAKKPCWKKVLVIAAPDHAWRCVRDLKKLGFEAEADDYFLKNGMMFYNKKSKQWWTRSRWQFWLREAPLRFLPFWLYNLIAG